MFERLEYSPIGKSTVNSLMELLASNKIDKNPDYQRFGNIWSIDKKQLLIDSIINGYDIPKLYFHYLASYSKDINNSGKLLAIIDGKQRIEAVQDFVEDKFKISKNFIYLKDPSINLKGFNYSSIIEQYPSIAKEFDNYKFDFTFIATDELERIDELFLRLNEGVPLNNSERRKSFGGYLVKYSLDQINKLDFFQNKIAFSNRRLEHFDLYTKLILIENFENLQSFTKNNLDRLIIKNKIESNDIEQSLRRLNNNLDLFSKYFEDKDDLLKSKSIVPLYYLFFFKNGGEYEKKIQFLRRFHELREKNRKDLAYNEVNQVMIEFDRLTQQGANQKKSLEKRNSMLTRFYEKYRAEEQLSIDTKISTEGLNLKKISSKDI